MKSLRSRLNQSLTFMLVLVFLGQLTIFNFAFDTVTKDQIIEHLQHDSEALFSMLSFDGSGKLILDTTGIEPIYQKPLSGNYYIIHLDQNKIFVSESISQGSLDARPLHIGEQRNLNMIGPGKQSIFLLGRSYQMGTHTVTITVAENLAETETGIRKLILASLLVILPLLIAAVILQNFLVKRALQPLLDAGEELKRVGRGAQAKISNQVPTEILPLVNEINRLLELVQRRLQQSRTAVGNLAHALKTPLAVLFRIADEPSLPDTLRRELMGQTSTINERVQHELKRARFAGGTGAETRINFASELAVMVKVLQTVYRDKALDIHIEAPDRLLPYDREDLLELIGNLADNACKWANHQVKISVKQNEAQEKNNKRLAICVADDGPGCAPEYLKELTERGVRIDESKNGHGLGLAIVKDIVSYYGGTLEIKQDQKLCGLCVCIELP